MLHLLLVLLFLYIWDKKKMRIFKNKITFFVFFSEACAAWGYHRSPTDLALLPAGQWVRRTNLPSAADFQFTDLRRFF